MPKLVINLFISLLFMSSFSSAYGQNESQINKYQGTGRYPQGVDLNLQKCISNAALKPFESLTDDDYLKITVLGCRQSNIVNIAGIEKLVNLSILTLTDNQINDITPLKELSSLNELFLWNNRITDIGPLSEVKQLEKLLLSDNRIADISPLEGLKRLSILDLANNQVNDLTPLEHLSKLSQLDVSGNKIRELVPLRDLTELTILYLQDNEIENLTSLAGLQSIDILFLGNNKITDIGPLAGLKKLRILNLNNNLVSDLTPLEQSKKLSRISLLNNCINNLTPVSQVEFKEGMEYQHTLCENPLLWKRNISIPWINEQVNKQCRESGQNEFSQRHEYDYFPDGIYYIYYQRDRQGLLERINVCRLSWDSNIDDILLPLQKTNNNGMNYEIYIYGGNNKIYVENGRIKGHAKEWTDFLDQHRIIEEFMQIFNVDYDIKSSRTNGKNVLLAEQNDHVLKAVTDNNSHSLQFFQRTFYWEKIVGRE